ncbi:MAG: hypothetical protein GY835_15500 [bacterium]|nr:hypothetical protein [bacterium]
MGAQLVSYYVQAKEAGGLKGKMRMAMITNIPSTKAENEPDSPENIQKFEDALTQIKLEA